MIKYVFLKMVLLKEISKAKYLFIEKLSMCGQSLTTMCTIVAFFQIE